MVKIQIELSQEEDKTGSYQVDDTILRSFNNAKEYPRERILQTE